MIKYGGHHHKSSVKIKSSYLMVVQVNMIEHIDKQQNSCNLHHTSDYMSGQRADTDSQE